MKLLHTLFASVLASISLTAAAVEPDGYYSTCENKGGASLLSALCTKVGPHTTVSYDGLWDVYVTSDSKPNGKIWDMYSTKEWTHGKERCGNYKLVGDCINREHSFPKSWFNNSSPMSSDAFHVYPTDGKVNGQRSNFPYGECAGGTTLASNGSVQALGKLGTSTFPGYTGKVFEPVDEYKGDFARSYFYMVAAYNGKVSGWDSDMLAGNAYPAFKDWAINLLLKWHRQDPVSQKELDRNEAVYAKQKNRNPFIDHPELAEYIWGDHKSESWTLSAGAQPAINTPASGTTIDLGTAGVGVARTRQITVKGQQLSNNVSLAISGQGWSVTPASLTAAQVNNVAGATATISYKAAAVGQSTATLTIASGDVKSIITLTAKALEGLPATDPTNITDESFVAHWTYVGNEDSNGCYTLYVKDANGDDVDTYPRSVKATDEEALVDELDAETAYTYWIQCAALKSNVIAVTTAAPVPSVQILYDGDLNLTAEPGVPGEPVELLLDIDNITADITFEINAPFELSNDRSNWSRTLTIDPREDRIYIRIYGDESGTFESEILVSSGDYRSDEAEVHGTISSPTAFFEDFEQDGAGNYTTTSYKGSACAWTLDNAGVYTVQNEAYAGTHYLRLGKNSTSSATMAEDITTGVGLVTVQAAGWSSADGASKFELDYSTDGGANWTSAGEASIAAPSSTTKAYAPYTFTVNKAGKVRLRLRQTFGQRMCIDNVEATSYRSGIEGTFADERGTGWDAWSVAGQLNVELAQPARVRIYAIDGTQCLDATLDAGISALDMEAGLYIVVVGESTRRVLVK